MSDTPLIKRLLIYVTQRGWRMFRNDCGQGYVGRLQSEYRSSAGSVVELSRAKRIRYGLTPGSSDLIGWRSIVITPDMVGQRIAQFTAVEAKTPGDRVRPDQRNFLDQVKAAGGYAAIGRESAAGTELEDV
ncbi:MAG: VRR-NUC domain-containing protein [Spirochaetota bacterium]